MYVVLRAFQPLPHRLELTISDIRQYAQLKFGWTAVELGNLLSLMGVTRIVALLVLIPLLCKLVRKPHQEPVRDSDATPASADQSSVDPPSSTISKQENEEWDRHKVQHRLIHDYSQSAPLGVSTRQCPG